MQSRPMADPTAPTPPPNPNAARGAQLVRLSRYLLLAGVLLMVGSCGAGIAIKLPALLAVGIALGFLVVIGAAVVGQIGRGLQGRVI